MTTIADTESVEAQKEEFNYDEAKVPQFTPPEILKSNSGKPITTVEEWNSIRRPEILKMFEELVYGKIPTEKVAVRAKVTESSDDALGGKAKRRQVTLFFGPNDNGPKVELLIYLPSKANGPVPAFMGLNFNGNHTVNADPAIHIPTSWVRNDEKKGIKDNKATADSRGSEATRWQAEEVVGRGYALVTAYYGDIDPDFDDGFKNGVHPLFYSEGKTKPAADEWGSIGAWAWGLSRALDYLETTPEIAADKVIVLGHSRLGKTSLWAGATDPRFAIVISNNSGCGGAAMSKRRFGETVNRINNSFPHWFCDNFNQFNNKEADLPLDQHMLIALIAPRPVYIASAEKDQWADPRGEFLSGLYASPVYKLLGTDGMSASEMPEIEKPVMSTIGYHIRHGEHDVLLYDWKQFLDFADKHLKR